MSDNDWYFHLFRITHILGGTLWVGAALFIALFLEPTVTEMGPDGGRVMQGVVQKRKLPVYMTVASWLTIGAGLLLYWRDSNHLEWDWISDSGPGIAFTVGGIVAILVAVMGQFINARAASQMTALGSKLKASAGPPDPADLAQMGALQARLRTAARAEAALMIFVVLTMAVGRHLII